MAKNGEKRVAVILSGCGVFDGAEIHEAVCTLLALDRHGAAWECLAPDKPFEVIDHATGTPTGEQRNCRTEAARIARGAVGDVATADAGGFDAVILPGGFGAAKNLCDFASKGPECVADAGTERFLRAAHAAGKPIVFLCIAPALCARVFGKEGVRLTIGTDAATAQGVAAMGATHVPTPVDEIVVDEKTRIVSTPAYMLAKGPAEVWAGTEKLVAKVLEMAR